MPVSVVGVDDPRLIRDGVKAIFDRGSECGAVGESENSAEAVQLCRKSRPDIVLMDIGLPGMTGIQRGDPRTRERSPRQALSTRELQVLRPVAQGKTCKDIAVIYSISGFETISSYRKTMTKKPGVNDVAVRTQLALAAGLAHGDKLDANSLG